MYRGLLYWPSLHQQALHNSVQIPYTSVFVILYEKEQLGHSALRLLFFFMKEKNNVSVMTERWLNDDRIRIFGWTVNWPLADECSTPEVQRQQVTARRVRERRHFRIKAFTKCDSAERAIFNLPGLFSLRSMYLAFHLLASSKRTFWDQSSPFLM